MTLGHDKRPYIRKRTILSGGLKGFLTKIWGNFYIHNERPFLTKFLEGKDHTHVLIKCT